MNLTLAIAFALFALAQPAAWGTVDQPADVRIDAPGRAPAAPDDYSILLKSGSLQPFAGDYSTGLAYLAANGRRAAVHMLVQLYETLTAPEREALAARGLQLLSYLPQRSWLARVSVDLSAADLEALGVRWLAPLELEQKVSERTLAMGFSPWSEYMNGQRIFAITMHEDVSESEGRAALEGWVTEMGGYVRSINTFIAVADPADVPALALADEVRWISERPPVLTAVNDGIREAIGVNPLHEAPYGLDGTGSNILVYDIGLAGDHIDFGTRVTAGEEGSIAYHSTHVAGTVGGDGSLSGGTYKGMAPNTLITSYVYEDCDPYCLYNSPQDIEANYTEGLYTYGADLATNSLTSNIALNGYDCAWEGDYELTAQLLDAICHGSLGLPFQSCWAAGNERADVDCGTTYWTTGVPATAKDIIACGATNSNDHSMTWFSSWGPVDDGRIRPDVCAPGCQIGGDEGITSTRPGNRYGSLCGTSMATPAVAGCLALVLQQYRATSGEFAWPDPATLKALLINTCQDYGNVGPDYQFGFGEIRPQAAVDVLRDRLACLEDTLDHGDQHEYVFRVSQPITELKATVVWSDPPGEQLAQFELVNDIDVWFESPSGSSHRPWILDPAHPEVAATRDVDSRNPVEQVLINQPAQGEWTLHVSGTNIPEGPQAYSVVANLPLLDPSDIAADAVATGIAARAYPNPFVGATTIHYQASSAGTVVEIEIRDVSGRVVRMLSDFPSVARERHVPWDGRDAAGHLLPAGVYFYRLSGKTAGFGERLLLLR